MKKEEEKELEPIPMYDNQTELQLVRRITEDMKAEYSPFYVHFAQVLASSSKDYSSEKFRDKAVADIVQKLEAKTAKADIEVCQRHNIHLEKFQALLQKYASDPEVKANLDLITTNHQRLLEGEPLDFELVFPAEVTMEKYFVLISEVLDKQRRSVYRQIRQFIRANGGKMMDKAKLKETLSELSVEEIREEVFKNHEIELTMPHRTVESVLKYAYYTFLAREGFIERQRKIYEKHEEVFKSILMGEIHSELE